MITLFLFLFVCCSTTTALNQSILYKANRGEEINDSSYELTQGKLIPEYLLTDKKIEIYQNGNVIKNIALKSPFNYKVISLVSIDKKYFASIMTVSRDVNRNAVLLEISIYNSQGILINKIKTDKLVFSIPELISLKNDWMICYHNPQVKGFGILSNNLDKFISLNKYVISVKQTENGFLVLGRTKLFEEIIPNNPAKEEWSLYFTSFDGKIIWENKFEASDTTIPLVINNIESCLILFQLKNSLNILGLNMKGIKYFNYVEDGENYYSGAIDKNYFYFSNQNVLKRLSLNTQKIDKQVKLKGVIQNIVINNSNLFMWQRDNSPSNDKYYLSSITSNFEEQETRETILPEDVIPYVKNIQIVKNNVILIFAEQIVVLKDINL